MFLITKQEIREQDGEASYYLFPKDIDFLAKNVKYREKFLKALDEEAIIASTVVKSDVKKLNLEELLDCGSGIHSKL